MYGEEARALAIQYANEFISFVLNDYPNSRLPASAPVIEIVLLSRIAPRFLNGVEYNILTNIGNDAIWHILSYFTDTHPIQINLGGNLVYDRELTWLSARINEIEPEIISSIEIGHYLYNLNAQMINQIGEPNYNQASTNNYNMLNGLNHFWNDKY